MLIYISGKMSGVPDYNKDKFARAELALRKRGHRVVNPHSLSDMVFARLRGIGIEPNKYDFMRADISALAQCDAILMLDDWRDSWGARRERFIAGLVFGMKVYYTVDGIG